MAIQNRLTKMLGVQYPIVQAPMGWIARAPLASAVSNAGGLGIIETSSGELEVVRGEIKKMKTLTSNRMRQFVDEARAEFDWVVIDTVPLVPLPDAKLLATMADAVLIVARAGKTAYDVLQLAVEALDLKQGRKR